MTKKHAIHHVDEAKNPDGSVNVAKAKAHLAHLIDQVAAGHYGIDLNQSDLGDGRVQVTGVRYETDPSVEAAPAPAV